MLDEIRAWLDEHLPIVPPRSALGKAMYYAHRQWPKLTVYLADGRLPIDNNLTENAIRPFVIGRKNFLYIFTDLPRATSVEQIEALLPVPAGDGNLAEAS